MKRSTNDGIRRMVERVGNLGCGCCGSLAAAALSAINGFIAAGSGSGRCPISSSLLWARRCCCAAEVASPCRRHVDGMYGETADEPGRLPAIGRHELDDDLYSCMRSLGVNVSVAADAFAGPPVTPLASLASSAPLGTRNTCVFEADLHSGNRKMDGRFDLLLDLDKCWLLGGLLGTADLEATAGATFACDAHLVSGLTDAAVAAADEDDIGAGGAICGGCAATDLGLCLCDWMAFDSPHTSE